MTINDPPKLEPKTKEVWAGLRVVTSMSSDLYTLVQDLRSRLTGYDSYIDTVNGSISFNGLESSMQADYADLTGYSDSDITATVDVLEANFSWSNYSDSSSGAPSQDGYDSYRSYLISNGLTDVEADNHIRLLKDWYDPSYTVHTDRDQIGSYSDWETYTSNAGMSDDRAAIFSTKLQDEFGVFTNFENDALKTDNPLTAILNQSGHNPESGGGGLGVKIWESSGTTPSGESAAPGDVSLRYNSNLYLEQTGGPSPDDDGGGDSGDSTPTTDISYSATSADQTTIEGEGSTQVSASITNNGDADATVNAPFTVNGETEGFISVDVPSGSTRTASTTFSTNFRDYGNYDVEIGDGGAVTITYAIGGF
jgi:hypothetical protein